LPHGFEQRAQLIPRRKKAQFLFFKGNIRPELEQRGQHNASYLDATDVQLAGILPSSVCHLIGRESFDFFSSFFVIFNEAHGGLFDY
jgi:hypothetical protein